MFCPQCGAQLPDGSKFCATCGTQLNAGSAVAPAPAVHASEPQVAPSRSKVGLVVAGVAALVVLALVIFGVARCAGGGSRGSAQTVADGVGASFDTMIEGGFSADAMRRGFDGLIDLMPQEAIDNILRSKNMTRQELSDSMRTLLGSVEDYTALVSLVDLSLSVSVGAPLDDDELHTVNNQLEAAGMSVNVTEGNHLSCSVAMSAFGYEDSQDVSESGMYAININGSWYLWSGDGLGV